MIHAHARALTLITETGYLFSLVVPSLGNGPFHIRLRTEMDVRRLGKMAQVDRFQHRLRFLNAEVDLRQCQVWQPVLDWPSARTNMLPQEVLLAQAWSLPEADFDPLDRDLFRSLQVIDAGAATSGGGLDAGSLWMGLRQRDVQRLKRGAHSLLGRGCGLTPSGDDFLLGVMAAIWLRWEDDPAGVCSALIGNVAQQTTRLSGAFLQAAARGAFREVWHQFFSAGMTSRAAVRQQINTMLAYGHSSGIFSLYGCQMGIKALTS